MLAKCPWKEHRSDSGRSYFYNTDTKESVWVIPKELEELKEQIEKEEQERSKYVVVVVIVVVVAAAAKSTILNTYFIICLGDFNLKSHSCQHQLTCTPSP